MQDGFIFSDTIARNIAQSDETPNKRRLWESVRIAQAQEFIESLPLGYNTIVGARGNGLSQGQRQRLLIARAVYKNPRYRRQSRAPACGARPQRSRPGFLGGLVYIGFVRMPGRCAVCRGAVFVLTA